MSKKLKLENIIQTNRRFSLLKARTIISQDSEKLGQNIMNFYKGSNVDHFDQMLKEIS